LKKKIHLDKNTSEIIIGVRPHDISLKKSTKGHKIEFVENLGNVSFCHIKLAENNDLIVESDIKKAFKSQDTVKISFNESDTFIFYNESGKRIK